MLVTLDAPYADTTAADLSFALGLPEQPALHVLQIPLPPARPAGLRLRLLGASHQVVFSGPAGDLIETVACLPGPRRDLPPRVDDGAGYRFAARIRVLDAAELTREVADLRDRLADDPHGLVGVFAGSPDAVTALYARFGEDAVTWRTWHAYPQTAELVETETVVTIS
ncbi:DUF2617 family protein [Solwaraspora sp. WMMD406]|uniref:DUF2617 family protein n=1 Tax=Solwaraspora sp. WMMD406 TaxID=3016095 RepID=UPI0024173FCB|nr:DUF2617 family protein [Solwaraspora sp. WMMD406]MDG4762686.1 DUF2617 family protein [Solwaraspora sp. WMMD406]